MRSGLASLSGVLALALVGCMSAPPGETGDDDGSAVVTGEGFTVATPDIDIQPGQEITYCYYFRTPNTKSLAIKRWASEMTPGSHHMIMYATGDQDVMPPGTVSASNCGNAGATSGGITAIWTYAAQTASSEVRLPDDDGTGLPLAQDVAPNTAAFFQMHYLNATDQVIKAHVDLTAEALEDGVAYTQTAAYVTFNNNIKIPGGAIGDLESQTCPTPDGAKFWLMSTHAHKQATHTAVKDGASVVFESDDWEHPGEAVFGGPAFYTFKTNKLTYECTYTNPSQREIKTGDSAATAEMCMASGYYFPAPAGPKFCFNNFVLP